MECSRIISFNSIYVVSFSACLPRVLLFSTFHLCNVDDLTLDLLYFLAGHCDPHMYIVDFGANWSLGCSYRPRTVLPMRRIGRWMSLEFIWLVHPLWKSAVSVKKSTKQNILMSTWMSGVHFCSARQPGQEFDCIKTAVPVFRRKSRIKRPSKVKLCGHK